MSIPRIRTARFADLLTISRVIERIIVEIRRQFLQTQKRSRLSKQIRMDEATSHHIYKPLDSVNGRPKTPPLPTKNPSYPSRCATGFTTTPQQALLPRPREDSAHVGNLSQRTAPPTYLNHANAQTCPSPYY